MNVLKLLFMSSLVLGASNANATIVDGVRQKPEPVKATFAYGEPFYVYNTGSKQFFKGANDWNTRGSVADTGYKVWVTKHLDAADQWDGKSVIIKDSVETQSAIKMVWAAADGHLWVDWANQADTIWTITAQGDEIYRFAAGPNLNADGTASTNNSAEGQFVGTKKADAVETRLYWNLAEADANCDWYFVSVADGEACMEAIALYNIAQELKKQLDEAPAGLDVSAYTAVYNNEAATADELNAAITAVKELVANSQVSSATASNPADLTLLVTNPSYDANSNDGWSGSTPGFQSYTDAEFFNVTFDTYQKVKNVTPGVYSVNLQAFYRAGDAGPAYTNYVNGENQNALLYTIADNDTLSVKIVSPYSQAKEKTAESGEKSVTAEDGTTVLSIPDNMQVAEAYFNEGLYNNKLFFSTDCDSLTIGLKKSTGVTNDWVLYDNWGLTYYGKGEDAYALWLEEVKKQATDYSAVSAKMTEGVVDAYNQKIASLTTATSKADVLAAIATIKTEAENVDANIEAWKSYKETLDRANLIANDNSISGEDKDDLADYLMDTDYYYNEGKLTTEELVAEIEKIEEMRKAAIDNGLKAPADVTEKYLVNANFEGTNGWTVKKAGGGNVNYGGTNTNKCFEAWNDGGFDVYQEVANAPVGVYEISVKGFYRYMRDANAYNAYVNGTAPNNSVEIYVNNKSSHFKSVFDEKVAYTGNGTGELYDNTMEYNKPYIDSDSTYWYPNDMINSSIAFANNLYKNSSYGIVANKGDVLRIGVRGSTNQQNDSWAIWDDFQMVFQGTNAEVVKPLLDAEISAIKDSISVVENSDKQLVGSEVITEVKSVYDEAVVNTAGTDGDKMFSSLTSILSIKDSLVASRNLFNTLNAKVDELSSAIASSKAVADTLTAASTYYETLNTSIAGKSLTNADVDKFVTRIDELIAALAIDKDMQNASFNNPFDATSMIKTPSFDKDGVNSVEGWNATGYNFGNDDTQKAALLLEYYNATFDINQTLTGIPNGTYIVQANGFSRTGSSAEDYELFKAGDLTTKAYLYAVSANDTVKSELPHVAAGATEDKGYTGTATIDEGMVVPSSMVSANAYFADGGYDNAVTINVTDQTLTLGILKEAQIKTDWTIFDNFRLTYLGNDPTAISSVASSTNAVNTEIFSLSGAKKNALTEGVNIVKTTMADGTVKVNKVIVK